MITFKLSEDFRTATAMVFKDTWQEDRRSFILLLALSVGIGLVPYAVNGSQALLLNHLVPLAAQRKLDAAAIGLVGLAGLAYLMQACLSSAYRYHQKLFWMDSRQRYELQLAEKLTRLDVATHEDPAFQDKITLIREQGSSYAITNFLQSYIRNFQNIAGVITASAVVCAIDWRFFVIILAASLPQFYSELRYGRGLWSIHKSQSPERRKYDEIARHTRSLIGLRELQTFQAAEYFIGRQKELLGRFLETEKAEERKRLAFMFGADMLLLLAGISILFFLVYRVAHGSLQVGTFVFVLGSIIGLEGTMTSFLLAVANQTGESRTVAAFFDIMHLEPKIQNAPRARVLAVTQAPHIEFRNVTFAYPTNPDEPIFRNLSLTIEPGERLALVGVNGAGKSTLIKLLCRFYDPTEGAIYIDGTDLRELDRETWYRHIALLSQDFARYNLQAWENIGLGRFAPGWEELSSIRKAARDAQAHLFIETWQEGYQQQLGQQFGGVDPSGGQWQKLALARVLFRDAFVTILDEPTAHVDPAAELEIFSNLQSELTRKQSLILISHRFSTVRQADKICVLMNGKVAEYGSHLELVKGGGEYAKLFKKQAAGYK